MNTCGSTRRPRCPAKWSPCRDFSTACAHVDPPFIRRSTTNNREVGRNWNASSHRPVMSTGVVVSESFPLDSRIPKPRCCCSSFPVVRPSTREALAARRTRERQAASARSTSRSSSPGAASRSWATALGRSRERFVHLRDDLVGRGRLRVLSDTAASSRCPRARRCGNARRRGRRGRRAPSRV